MLSFHTWGHGTGPHIFALHWLGGSAHTWTEVAETLAARGIRFTAIDLPGFGDSASTAGFSVAAMRTQVRETIQSLRQADAAPWLLAGHSMGGKVAAALARDAVDGDAALRGLQALLLVSPSPPSPEPMDEKVRQQMLASLGQSSGSHEKDRKAARQFIENNVGKNSLLPEVLERAVAGVLQMNRTAFRQWLQSGSKEDWSAAVGRLPLPALVLAGSEEPALGPVVQQQLTAPHFQQAQVTALEGSGHLSPLERPFEVAEHFSAFIAQLGLPIKNEAVLPAAFTKLIESPLTSPQTRALLQSRLDDDSWNASPQRLTLAQFMTLRALAARILPHPGFDLAARIAARLGTEDGWRFDELPPDVEAWQAGIAALDSAAMREHGVAFLALHDAQKDALIAAAGAGSLRRGVLDTALDTLHAGAARHFDAAQMKLWMEDVRGLCAQLYMADPRTYARIGYTGFADNEPFTQITLGTPDDRLQMAAEARR
jgi:pimeloyl-ACP methyl ester carboxylesterase